MSPAEIKALLEECRLYSSITKKAEPAGVEKQAPTFCVRFGFQGRDLSMEITFPLSFPYSAPTLQLRPWNQLGFLPHVEETGEVCYTGKEDMVLNPNDPSGIVIEAHTRVVRILEQGIAGTNASDFTDEFESYWTRNQHVKRSVICNVTIDDCIKSIGVALDKSHKIRYIADDISAASANVKRFINNDTSSSCERGLYISLGKVNLAPPPYDTMWTAGEITQLIADSLDKNQKERIKELVKKGKNELVIFRIESPQGNNALFGFRFKNVKSSGHPLTNSNPQCQVEPLEFIRVDKGLLMPRGGASEAVSSKRGLLIGCGAIGGFIAHELIRSGITALCLIDNQKLRPENSYRHVSGYVSSDKVSKVDALKESLELYYPYCNISAHAASFEAVIGRGKVKMNDFDFVVVATGNPSTNFYIDTYYRNAKPGTPVIYTWLDPFGIGGHVLITNITSKGCYHCLYDNDDLHNRASWAAPLKDQPRPFLRSISGCGTRYTPYSALDASQTAILATRKTMNVLMGNEKENAIYGWRGSTDVFQKEGYKLSKRFTELSDEDLHNTRNGFSSKQCTHCK